MHGCFLLKPWALPRESGISLPCYGWHFPQKAIPPCRQRRVLELTEPTPSPSKEGNTWPAPLQAVNRRFGLPSGEVAAGGGVCPSRRPAARPIARAATHHTAPRAGPPCR